MAPAGPAAPASASAWRVTLISATLMALALTGDALLYVVLPVTAEQFGLTAIWVGVLLSMNRFVRVFLYGAVARLGMRIGPRRLSLVAAVGATVSTLMYGVVDGGPLQTIARVIWGLSFAALNLVTLVYAYGEKGDPQSGWRMGVSRSIRNIGPALACALGAWAAVVVGPRETFVILAVLTAPCVVLALMLPPSERAPGSDQRVWRKPRAIDTFVFVFGAIIDGGFIMTLALVMGEDASPQAAIVAAGLSWSLRFVLIIVISPVSGWLADRIGAEVILVASSTAVALGLGVVAAGLLLDLAWLAKAGAISVIVSRSVVDTVVTVVAADRSPGAVMLGLSMNATWRDFGAAVGPLGAGFLIGAMRLDAMYVAMTLGFALAVAGVAATARYRR